MKRMVQGSLVDEHGDPYDYEWDLFQRSLGDVDLAQIFALKPPETGTNAETDSADRAAE